MVKNALAGPKNNCVTKNEREMRKYSLRYHTQNFKALRKKNDKGTQLNFKKGCFMEQNCLAIKRHIWA